MQGEIPNPGDQDLSQGTYGCGWAGGKPHWEVKFKPHACWDLCRTNTRLLFGQGLGKTGIDATAFEIIDCMKSLDPKTPFNGLWTNCVWWAKRKAMPSCGLKFCSFSL
jgi:hypothetical protein